MEKVKTSVREVLYRCPNSSIEVVLLTKRTSGGTAHNAYLKREGQRLGPSVFLGFTAESNVYRAAEKVTDLVKASVTAAMLHCWQTIYRGMK